MGQEVNVTWIVFSLAIFQRNITIDNMIKLLYYDAFYSQYLYQKMS